MVVSSVHVIQLEAIITFAIIIPDSAIANQESVVLDVINVWMDIMAFPTEDVEVSLFFC